MTRAALALTALAQIAPALAAPMDVGDGVFALEPGDVPPSVLGLATLPERSV